MSGLSHKLFIMKRFFYVTVLIPLTILANPNGPQIMHGNAILEEIGKTLSITTSDKTIIHWDDFSNQPGELIRFLQPDNASSVLNRVTSKNPSFLLGDLESNGRIFLINPNGVFVGENAIFQTGGFIASTFDVLDEAYIRGGELEFQGDSQASINNLGSIQASQGDIMLFAAQIDNLGQLSAPQGTVGLGSAPALILKPNDQQRVFIVCKGDEKNTIYNRGVIEAIQVEIKSSGNPYSLAFSHEGTIDALGIQEQGGSVYLVADDSSGQVLGSIAAKNSDKTGGTVHVLGKSLFLSETSNIDVSGDLGGGTVLIGGDYQGQNADIPNADNVLAVKGATISADALIAGDGGKVVLWSEEYTGFLGKISAMGGTDCGNGGFTEISGKSLGFDGLVHLQADHGKPGLLFLDPTDIRIDGALCPTVVVGAPTTWTAPCGCPVNITPAAITAVLNGGGNVTINTSTPPNLACVNNGTITVLSAILWNSATPGALTLTADNNILVQANILDSSALIAATPRITLNATNNITIDALTPATIVSVGSQNAETVVNTGGVVNVNGGNGNFQAAQIGCFTPAGQTSTGPISITGSDLNLNPGRGVASCAQVGHGIPNSFLAYHLTETTASATIDVNVTGSVNLTGGPFASFCAASIGHGSNFLTAGPGSNQDGNITVTANAVNILGGVNTDNLARIGHGALIIGGGVAGATTLNGVIKVNATQTVLLEGGLGSFAPVQIGHGAQEIDLGAATTHSGDILVTAGQTVTLLAPLSTGGGNCPVFIGHGAEEFGTPGLNTGTNTLTGNITVTTTTGNIIFNQNPAGTPIATAVNSPTFIGHGSFRAAAPAIITANGNISVNCGANLVIDDSLGGTSSGSAIGHVGDSGNAPYNPVTGNISVSAPNGSITLNTSNLHPIVETLIGHGSLSSNISFPNITSNITVCTSGDLNQNAGTGDGNHVIIGHFAPNVLSATGIYRVTVGGNVNQTSPGGTVTGNDVYIGGMQSGGTQNHISTLLLSVCGDFNITTTGTPLGAILGFGFGNTLPTADACPVFAAIGGSINAGGSIKSNQFIAQGGDLNIAVGGNMTIGSIGTGRADVGTDSAFTTRLFVGGNLTCTETVINATQLARNNFIGQFSKALDLRAGGNIQICSGILAPTSPISIQAGYAFNSGDLWNSSAAGITTIAGQSLTPGPLTFPCGSCSTFQAFSQPVGGICGSFSVQSAVAVNMQTPGDFILKSLCNNCSGGPSADAILSAGAAGGINFLSVGGNTYISGFPNIQVNKALSTTNGDITLNACTDVNVNFAIAPGTAGNAVCIASDIDLDGTGDINIHANITTQNGPINLTAGTSEGCENLLSFPNLGTPAGCQACAVTGCQLCGANNANINQFAGTAVTSGSGNINAYAENNINILGLVGTTTGFIHSGAGNNTTIMGPGTIAGTVASNSGEIRMTSGTEMILTGTVPNAVLINAPNSVVTLVCDSCFPNRPGIGTGSFSMNADSVINAQQLQIFTATQNLNTIDGSFNGPSGPCAAFKPGTLFADTSEEIWCTYFNCNAAFPDAGTPCYTVFYKNCKPVIIHAAPAATEANKVVSEMLLYLQPTEFLEIYDRTPWLFLLLYDRWSEQRKPNSLDISNDELYWIIRRKLHFIDFPRTIRYYKKPGEPPFSREVINVTKGTEENKTAAP